MMKQYLTFAVSLGIVMLAGSLLAADAADEAGFKPIFDGKTLDGWDGNPKLWRVEQGAITGETTAANPIAGNTFLIWRGGQPADFELRVEFRMPNPGLANSGIQYRSREEPQQWGQWVIGGYQADLDGVDEYTGGLYEERGRRFLAERGQKVEVGQDHKPKLVDKVGDAAALQKKINKGGWNEYRILARGNHLQQFINGQLMADVTDNDSQMQRSRGLIALQLHVGPPMKVQFRNVRLRVQGEGDGANVRP